MTLPFPVEPPPFDFAAASAYIQTCQVAATELADIAFSREHAAAPARRRWEGAAADRFEEEEAALVRRWSWLIGEISRAARVMSEACENAIRQQQAHADAVTRWVQDQRISRNG
jgi:hypothetical protein